MNRRMDPAGRLEECFSILDHVPDGVLIVAPDYRLVFWNCRLEAWTGLSRRELLGTSLLDRYPHLGAPRYADRLAVVLAGGPPAVFSSHLHRSFLPCRLPDGRERIQHTVVSPIANPEGGHLALFAIQDVSDLAHSIDRYQQARRQLQHEMNERKRAQQSLIEAERMAVIGTLAAGIAHNFNNINAGILGHLDLLLRRGGLPEAVAGKLRLIMNTVHRSVSLTENLMVFCGQRKGEKLVAPLDNLLIETVELIRDEYRDAGIEIAVDLRPTPPVRLSPGEIGHVVLNLLVNARHALTAAPRKRIELTTGVEAGQVFIRVADTGCGIPEELRERIFLPFFTTKGEYAAPGSPLAEVKGTGLGLSVSRTIVHDHQGRIELDDAPGGGAVFTIWLPPAASAAEEAAAGEPRAAAAPTARRVLVLDDESAVRSFIAECLDEAGCQVECLTSGETALERLAAEAVDLVLVDLQMPNMDGREFLRRLRAAQPAHRPRILVMTGQLVESSALDLKELGAAGVLKKPFGVDELLACL